MSDNGNKQEMNALLDRMEALREKVEGNPRMMAILADALRSVDVDEVRQSARQKVLEQRGIEPRAAEIDHDWLEEQLRESRIDMAVLLVNVGAKTIRMNTRAAFKSLWLAVKIIWKAGRDFNRIDRG